MNFLNKLYKSKLLYSVLFLLLVVFSLSNCQPAFAFDKVIKQYNNRNLTTPFVLSEAQVKELYSDISYTNEHTDYLLKNNIVGIGYKIRTPHNVYYYTNCLLGVKHCYQEEEFKPYTPYFDSIYLVDKQGNKRHIITRDLYNNRIWYLGYKFPSSISRVVSSRHIYSFIDMYGNKKTVTYENEHSSFRLNK